MSEQSQGRPSGSDERSDGDEGAEGGRHPGQEYREPHDAEPIAIEIDEAAALTEGELEKVEAMGAGGLSGAPVFERSTAVLRRLRERLPASIDLVGVGGVVDAATGLAKLEAGAALVQVYSGMVYAGPTLPSDINRAVLRSL